MPSTSPTPSASSARFYSLASVAFVGGSLIPHGGQNPIEAIRLGAAVMTGPHWENFREVYADLLTRQGLPRSE